MHHATDNRPCLHKRFPQVGAIVSGGDLPSMHMTQQGVRWTADQVLALAPDAASRKAGSRLGAAGPWSEAGSYGRGAVWGLCKGSGSKPYQTVRRTRRAPRTSAVARAGSSRASTRWGCCCSGRGEDGTVPRGQAPDWAEEWLEGRDSARTEKASGDAAGRPGRPRRLIRRPRGAGPSAGPSGSPAGAQELEQRLTDLLRGGLAAAEQAGYGLWEETAARMVDAQAPGLAGAGTGVGGDPGVRPRLAGAAAGGVRAAASAGPGLAAASTGCRSRWPRRSARGSG